MTENFYVESNMEKIRDFFGKENHDIQLIEECAELIQAIAKVTKREKIHDVHINDYEHLIEEIADVELLLEHCKHHHNITDDEVEEMKNRKVNKCLLYIDHLEKR